MGKYRIVRSIGVLVLVASFGMSQAETRQLVGTVTEVGAGTLTLQTSQGPVPIRVTEKSQIWMHRKRATLPEVVAGIRGNVRATVDDQGVTLKEFADEATAAWLQAIRRVPQRGRIVSRGVRGITVEFEDRSTFQYRVTEKSKVTVGGADSSLDQLADGTVLTFHGRLLSNSETWLRLVTDVMPEPKPTPGSSSSRSRSVRDTRDAVPPRLPANGEVEGVVTFIVPRGNLFDVEVDGARYHITVVPATQFMQDGRRVSPGLMELDLLVKVRYRQDRFGKLIASRVTIL
ncbi:MAG: hypothetical protein SFX74_10605 [Fimbriimonadaceae bacterium]|nr:hypothetical protein [Fimbriimonadaceae bacterium]